MNKFSAWFIATIIVMIGFPWLAVTFAGSAGKNIKQLWMIPMVVAGLYLAGVWMFFEMGESAFLLYAGIYLLIGIVAMFISAFYIKNSKFKCF